MGGTVVLALHPIGLSNLLEPIDEVLNREFGETTFGEAIVKLRHSFLVHGDFSPTRVEHLVSQTQMRNPMQQQLFAQLAWVLFHRLVIFDLQLLSLIGSISDDFESIILRYMKEYAQN